MQRAAKALRDLRQMIQEEKVVVVSEETVP